MFAARAAAVKDFLCGTPGRLGRVFRPLPNGVRFQAFDD
jgi:hypothetical protein